MVDLHSNLVTIRHCKQITTLNHINEYTRFCFILRINLFFIQFYIFIFYSVNSSKKICVIQTQVSFYATSSQALFAQNNKII